jgi:hypothetical protein
MAAGVAEKFEVSFKKVIGFSFERVVRPSPRLHHAPSDLPRLSDNFDLFSRLT